MHKKETATTKRLAGGEEESEVEVKYSDVVSEEGRNM